LLTAEPEPIRRSWTIQWGGALATAAAAAVFLALIAGDMTGVFEQTGLDARGDAASVAVTATEAEMAVAADTAAAPVAASAAEGIVVETTAESEQVEGSDDSATDAADAGEAVAAMAAPAPAAAATDEPAAESAVAPQAAAATRSNEEPMEGADLMPFAGSETAVVDESIDVEEALAKDIAASDDEAAAAPAPALAAKAPVSGDDSLVSDDAEPQQLTFGTTADDLAAVDGDASGNGAEDDAIALPLWQLQIAAGALLALLLAATLGLMMRRRHAL
jgi:hypothetical protein